MIPVERECPLCGARTTRVWCCGLDLAAAKPWRMTGARVHAVHVLARAQKGLDEETYRARLGAVGLKSCLDMNRLQFHEFMRALRALPDAPERAPKAKQPAGLKTP